MRPFQGLETNNFTAKTLFMDHAIKEEIKKQKTKKSKLALKAKLGVSCEETNQPKTKQYA